IMATLEHYPPRDHEHGDSGNAQLWIKTAILLGLGVYFVYNIISGNLTNYVNERFAWLSYVAAALFLITGLYSLYHLLTAHRGHDHAEHEHSHEGHHHGQMSWGVLAIVAIPLLLGTLIPSRPLGAEAV